MIPKERAKVIPFHSRRLTLPNDKGWIEVRGQFNPFDLDEEQRKLISMMADWFRQFDATFDGTTPCACNEPERTA